MFVLLIFSIMLTFSFAYLFFFKRKVSAYGFFLLTFSFSKEK